MTELGFHGNQIHSVDLLFKSATKDIAITLDNVLAGKDVSCLLYTSDAADE